MKSMIFWGYNNEHEAQQDWDLSIGKKTIDKVIVCSKGKECIGSIDGKNFMYKDGTTDNGREIKVATVIIGNNKIKFTLYSKMNL